MENTVLTLIIDKSDSVEPVESSGGQLMEDWVSFGKQSPLALLIISQVWLRSFLQI